MGPSEELCPFGNAFNSSIVNIYCYNILLLRPNFAVLCSRWVFFQKIFCLLKKNLRPNLFALVSYKSVLAVPISPNANLCCSIESQIYMIFMTVGCCIFETSNMFAFWFTIFSPHSRCASRISRGEGSKLYRSDKPI